MKKVSLLLIIWGFFINYSTSQEKNKLRNQLFNLDWKFNLGNPPNAQDGDLDDSNWRSLDLPHDWSIEGKVALKNPSGNDGGYFPTGLGWYRKSFHVPAAKKGQNISIYFEGVYMNSEVFINGKSLGLYPYGYTSFSYDLSPYLYYGENNTIAVKVDNSAQKNSRWYTGSGIYRNVWLITKNKLSVAQWGIGIKAENISSTEATVKLNIQIDNNTASSTEISVRTIIIDAHGQVVSKNNKMVKATASVENEMATTLLVKKPMLWSPDAPNLYTARVEVLKGKDIIDRVDTKFGIRNIEFHAATGFILNGNKIKLNGGNVHHDNGSLGAAAYDRAEVRKVELLKAAGFNAVRSSHNPPSSKFLQACDSIGLLVIDEAFDGWKTKKTDYDYAILFEKWAKKDVQAMVKRDRNHPSIILWSIGNEIIERKEPDAVKTAKMLRDAIREIDDSRPVVSAMTTWDKEWEIFDPLMAEHDVAGYNYQLHRAPKDHERVPDRIIVQTESYPRDAFANWKLVHDHPFIIGDFVWTAIDYLGESGIGRWFYTGEVTGEHYDRDLFPWHGAYCGDIDLTGWRKPISHYRDILYNGGSKLHLAVREPNPEPLQVHETLWSVWPTWESWNWKGYENKNLEVEVYSSHPKVRLYLNGDLLGEKLTGENEQFKATFQVPYQEGELKAIALDRLYKEIEQRVLKTANKIAKIRMKADRKEIQATGQDLSYITIEVIDNEGTVCDGADEKLTFTIEGPGTLIGIDNANLKDTEPYTSQSRKVWKGRALAIIKGATDPGNIKITVNYPGIPKSEIIIDNK
ncbi:MULTISPECIES: glycoside hydrolase family 2 TIM barrel-domain containing protein [Sphingobacterium]|uniref:glycoside hydrolase family 2 TIM barrel-domain containing protein n=1 Tax=Sphingobacterium TaxID=28453 RepID=UPI00104C5601|nr:MULTISPECIES: glycoside hydrolase family 2 TIM barrel-domain containing protein [Sphingobacterium]MCW2263068.1 beta-galactosidase [Sphingobacterium kitahiroshimense]TCR11942.1 beta-galactosidase [Sphingobacterium sp. JUb78]